MKYITEAYYTDEFGGISIVDNTAFDICVKRASREINRLCNGHIERVGIDNLDDIELNAVKEATALMVEFLYLNGLESLSSFNGGFSIGNYSVSGGDAKNGAAYPPTIDSILVNAGLISAVAECHHGTIARGNWI